VTKRWQTYFNTLLDFFRRRRVKEANFISLEKNS